MAPGTGDGRSSKRPEQFFKVLCFVDPFLDVEAVLKLRACSKPLFERTYRPCNRTLSFSGLCGFDGKQLVMTVLPLALKATRGKSSSLPFSLDFTNCSMIRDTSLARICEQVPLKPRERLGMVERIHLDFCFQVTDKGLKALLGSSMRSLHTLSLKGARSKLLTGEPFLHDLCPDRWPKFTHFSCAFTNMWLKPVSAVGEFIVRRGKVLQMEPTCEIAGSYASKCLLEREPFRDLTHVFCDALRVWDMDMLARTSKKIQDDWRRLTDSHVLISLNPSAGSRVLVNAPVTKHNADGQGDVWTLPLALAAQSQQIPACRLLIKRGADVDCWDHMGCTPLYYASSVDSREGCALLLATGASSTPHAIGGYSALTAAIQNQNLDICELLLNRGASVNFTARADKSYRSPLHLACDSNYLNAEICGLLLSRAADPNWCSIANRCTPALLAYKADHSVLPLFLRCGAGGTKATRWVLSEVAVCAIAQNDLESVHSLVTAQPTILSMNHPFWGAPHLQCARIGNSGILAYLLSEGSDLMLRGNGGLTALHVAAREGNENCVRVLLEYSLGVVDPLSENGQTPLHLACLENHATVAELLLQGGASPNLADLHMGETPLMLCLLGRHEETALSLLRSSREGLDFYVMNHDGQHALNYALHYGMYAVALQLICMGCNALVLEDSQIEVAKKRMATCKTAERRKLRKLLRMHSKAKKGERRNEAAAKSPGGSRFQGRYVREGISLASLLSKPVDFLVHHRRV